MVEPVRPGETAVPSGPPHRPSCPTGPSRPPGRCRRCWPATPGTSRRTGIVAPDLARGGCRLGGPRRGVRAGDVRRRRGGPGLARRDRRHRRPNGGRGSSTSTRASAVRHGPDPNGRPGGPTRMPRPPDRPRLPAPRSREDRRRLPARPSRGGGAPSDQSAPDDRRADHRGRLRWPPAAGRPGAERDRRPDPARTGRAGRRRRGVDQACPHRHDPRSGAPVGPGCCRPGCAPSAPRTSRCRSRPRWPRSRPGASVTDVPGAGRKKVGWPVWPPPTARPSGPPTSRRSPPIRVPVRRRRS